MERLVPAGAALIAVTYGLARFSLGLFAPELRADFSLSSTGIGWLMAGSFAGYVGALLAAGRLVGALGPRRVALGAGLVATVGMGGMAAAPHPLVLGLAATAGGASTGLVSPALAAAVEQRLAAGRRASAQTIINAGTSVGLTMAVPVALVLAASWRAAWAVFALAALAATAGTALALRPDTAPTARRSGNGGRLSGRLRATAVLLGLSSATFWGFGREVLESLAGLSPAISRSAWVAVGAGGLAGAAAGHLSVRAGLRGALVAGWLPLTGALGLLAASPAGPIGALLLAGAFGAGYMALTGLLIVWSVQERPIDPATAVAAAFVLLAVGQVAGSPVAGALVDHLGLAPAFLAASATAAAGMATLPARTGSAVATRESGFGGIVSTTGISAIRNGRRAGRRWRPVHTGGRAMSTGWRRFLRRHDTPGLMRLDDALRALGRDGDLGVRLADVRIVDVVGSATRYTDFDEEFRLVNGALRPRWDALARAMASGVEPPPVELMQLGELYFVKDGHHRVSVARSLGRQVITARVHRVCTVAYARACVRAAHLPSKAPERRFLERVPLPDDRRRQLWLDEPAKWARLADAAEAWGLRRSLERRAAPSRTELAVSWWAEEVEPLVARLRAAGVGTDLRDVQLYVTALAVRDRLGTAGWPDDIAERLPAELLGPTAADGMPRRSRRLGASGTSTAA